MSKRDKLIERLLSSPTDFTYDELVTVVGYFGFQEVSPGQSGGSSRKFIRRSDRALIMLHEPHPSSIIKTYAIKEIIEKLKEFGDL